MARSSFYSTNPTTVEQTLGAEFLSGALAAKEAAEAAAASAQTFSASATTSMEATLAAADDANDAAVDASEAASHAELMANAAIQAVADINAALSSKADADHEHIIADITGLQAALDNRALAMHTHTIGNVVGLADALLATEKTTNRGVPGGYASLDPSGKVPLTQLPAGSTFSGSYNDLDDLPTLFSGVYADLIDKPVLANVATTGSYLDLSNRPTIFSGAYADLTGKPTLFSGDYADLTGRPSLASVATSGAYADLSGRPTFATVATSGSYTDLSNRPTNLSQFTNNTNFITTAGARTAISVTGSLSYNNTTGVISYTAPTLATVATSGSYTDLTGLQTVLDGKLDLAGGTLTGKAIFPAATTSGAFLNLPHGSSPTTPVNGDVWTTTSGLLARINGTTVTFHNTSSMANVNQAEAEAGTGSVNRAWTSARVRQNVAAYASPLIHTHAISDTTGLQTALDGKAGTAVATTSADGLMSSSDKTKLNAVGSMANRAVTISSSAPSGGNDGDIWYQV